MGRGCGKGNILLTNNKTALVRIISCIRNDYSGPLKKQFLDNATTSTVVSLSYVLFFYFDLLKAAVSEILIFGKM